MPYLVRLVRALTLPRGRLSAPNAERLAGNPFPSTLAAALLALLAAPSAWGADYQRYITFKNDFKFPIYPVIQVPEDNCIGGSTRVRRIIVNGQGHNGLKAGEKVTVLIPPDDKRLVTVKVNGQDTQQWANCWYRSGRIYVFPVDLAAFEAAMVKLDSLTVAQTTQYQDSTFPRKPVTCFMGGRADQPTAPPGQCFTGVAKSSFAADVPAQLAEYTFDSDFADTHPPGETPVADTGRPMADIDVSHVDDIYLPIAASVYNHGATGYMGSGMPLLKFKQRMEKFRKADPTTGIRRWPIYRAYLPASWNNNAFSPLMPPLLGGLTGANPNTTAVRIAEHMPAMFNLINNTLSTPRSAIYSDPVANYLISGVSFDAGTNIPASPIMQQYVDRWMLWINNDPCTNLKSLIWPDNVVTGQFDTGNFCAKFRDNVRYVWNHFYSDKDDGFQANQEQFRKDCGLNAIDAPYGNIDLDNACIIQHIVGYISQILGGELPGRVQAALRGVAYDPVDGNPQYQFDPFLTFAAPYNSQFNLDPFTRFIHNTTDGVAAVAYSFSIDDKYGNFRDASSGFLIDAGGVSALENPAPYDPYQQYRAGWGYNKDDYSLAWLASGTDPAGILSQLAAIADSHGKRAILLKQDDRLSMVGLTAAGTWQLTALATLSDLQYLADQENTNSKGAETFYQTLINHTFGDQSVFPSVVLDVNAINEAAIGLLSWNTDTDWNLSKLKLYDIVAQKNATVSTTNNWVSGSFCGQTVPIATDGNQSLAFPLQADGSLKPCDLVLQDRRGDQLVLKLAPVPFTVEDTYTGAKQTVMGLPHGKTPSGDPLISHTLSDADLQYCRNSSSLDVAVLGLCENVTLSATWSIDPLARDTVYMGLDFVNMPRVNVNLPVASITGVDPERPLWHTGAKVTATVQPDGKTVNFSWPAAQVKSGKPIKYELTYAGVYQPSCANDQDPANPSGAKVNLQTYCNGVPFDPGSANKAYSLIGINFTADPMQQTEPLTGTVTPSPAPRVNSFLKK